MAKLDQIIADINEETNALAAKIDSLEVAAGGTVTQAQLDTLQGISARLKSLAAPEAVPTPVVVVPAAPSTPPAPVPGSSSAG